MSATRPPTSLLPARAAESHKGTYGHALLVGGSVGMTGAISLAGMAALRGGAGLVTLAVPASCWQVVAGLEPSYMTLACPSNPRGRLGRDAYDVIASFSERATCMASGPGLGSSADARYVANRLYASVSLPIVVDADALNALSQRSGGLRGPAGPRILTPHPGEFRRLAQSARLGTDTLPISQMPELAEELARRFGVTIVLKGHRTLVTDGTRSIRNETGNPGMATGGCGDVLTGLIAALICQGLPLFDAAWLGVHLHGLAGDKAASHLGQVSLTARDLIDFLPAAIMEWQST
ncbi:MAG: NAD(P)H-hydrate dehydratase [Pirellulaceae bacterium]|nr:NAD(P)H-hydrate dehydratase [Planctomycetales bacterium]